MVSVWGTDFISMKTLPLQLNMRIKYKAEKSVLIYKNT